MIITGIANVADTANKKQNKQKPPMIVSLVSFKKLAIVFPFDCLLI